jgi:hypothetical protein
VSLLLLLGAGVALAQECPVPLEPEAMALRLEAVKDGVLFGEPAAKQELSAIEASLPCLTGPLDQAELGKLMLGQAAYGTFMGQESSVYYQRAAGFGAGDPDYGPEVQAKLDAVQPSPPALLILDFEPVPAVILVDGVITYSTGPRELASGWHIVQWLQDDGWQVRVLELGPSQEAEISVRAAPAPPVDQAAPEQVLEKTPREPRTSDRGGLASAAAGYQLAVSKVGREGQSYEGLQGGPVLVLRARTAGTWHLRLGAELSPGASGARTGSPTRAHLAAGWQQDHGLGLGLAVGPVLGGASLLVLQAAGEDPNFEPGRAWGAGVLIQLQPIDSIYLELQGQWIDAGFGVALLAQLHLVDLGPVPLLLSVGGQHWQSAESGRLSWAQLGVGSTLTF